MGLTYDAAALIAAESGVRSIWQLHRRALDRGERPVVPAGVLGQVWRHGPQVMLSRFLRGCVVEVLDDARTKRAGEACGRAGTSDVIDASVVVGALARRDVVVSSDAGDLHRIAAGLNQQIEVLKP